MRRDTCACPRESRNLCRALSPLTRLRLTFVSGRMTYLYVCDTAVLRKFACSPLGIVQELLKATSTSTVVQFSFVSSSGFRGAAAATGSHSVHPADCWVHERQRSFFQRFATFVPLVSVVTPQAVSGSTFVNDGGFPPINVHLVFSAEMVSEGMYLQAGCVRALPEACVSRSSFEFCWDFALLRSVDGGRCVASQCKCIYFAANTDTEPTVERACSSYIYSVPSDRKAFRASTRLGARLLQSELLQKCAKRLQLAVASVLDCNATETIQWDIPVPLTSSGFAALALRPEQVWSGDFG